MLGTDDVGPYEGLIHSTAARYEPYLDDELEDIAQLLRLKVWQARRSYDPALATQTEEGYVFSCVVNRVKDMLKAQSRLNKRRQGGPLYIEDVAASSPAAFESKHFSTDGDPVADAVEEEKVKLPSTLTHVEHRVVVLLLLDLRQTEISVVLGIPRARVRAAHAAAREKLALTGPDQDPGQAATGETPEPLASPERAPVAA